MQLGNIFCGFLFDRTGSYTLSFGFSMAVLGLAIVCAWLAGRQWRAEAGQWR